MSLRDHVAPGQAAGYLWQIDHALYYLAAGSGDRVGVETLDDVAVIEPRAGLKLIQSKSTLDPNRNPVSDSSPALWKTLAIWANALQKGEIDPSKTQLFLVTNANLSDCLATRLGRAVKPAELAQIVAELRSNPKTPSQSIGEAVAAVRGCSDDQLTRLCSCVQVLDDNHRQSFDDLHADIIAKCHLPASVDSPTFLDAMLGWVHTTVMQKWQAGHPAWIQQQHFNDRLHAVIENVRRRRSRELPARQLVCTETEIMSHKASLFVRQIDVIDADDAEVTEAIIDYLRHNRERLRLVHEGIVTDDDWAHFDDLLVEHWRPVFRQQQTASTSPAQRKQGKRVYIEIQKHRERLAGDETDEYYLTRGAYHRLADALVVGWHAKFADKFKISAKPSS
ncbi:MAG: hypothetical protein HY287_02340 [Planctomycetes bacterium]|nr:hypothetical protein [Planctomycetota bacterium]MBI3833148.1 hypothetical protein [Planctomycetota bacterium]